MTNKNDLPPDESKASPLDYPIDESSAGRLRGFGKAVRELVFKRKNEDPIQEIGDTVPQRETITEDWDDVRAEIENDPLLEDMPDDIRHEAVELTYELYKAAREKVAPVITGFADSLLQEAGGRQIVFAARDGLGAYHAANILKKKFDYGNEDPEQLVYAYLTRTIVYDTPPATLREYLEQVGVHDVDANVVLADIGMYGTILPGVRNVLPNMEPRYLISKTSEVPGYADGQSSRMTSTDTVMGNPAVHFLEDTFSGPIPSPKSLIHSSAELEPDTVNESFPLEEMLKRKYALQAIQDYTANLDARPMQPATEAIRNLDLLLTDTSAYEHLMVSHTR
ncbi:MAG TPA: hypothetical protein VK497_02905 [Candidatus Saccharimonadales bacterium]|nr:hypothetical protein [Candidatus Saccharimonadales bacterium]